MRITVVSIAVCLAAIATSNAFAVIIVDGATSNRHNRPAAPSSGSSTFVGHTTLTGLPNLDLSGVGRLPSGGGFTKWATLISPEYFVSANHFRPSSGTLTFVNESNGAISNCLIDTAAGTNVTEVDAVNNPSDFSSDLYVGKIIHTGPGGSCDPANLIHYDIALPGNYDGEEVYHVGISGGGTLRTRVGRNRQSIAGVGEISFVNSMGAVTFTSFGGWSWYADDTGDTTGDSPTGVTAGSPPSEKPSPLPGDGMTPDSDETYFQGGDSGGPTFWYDAATMKWNVIGIHSGTGATVFYDGSDNPFFPDDNTPPSAVTGERRASLDTYLPFFRDQVLAIAVPEPSPMVYLGIVLSIVGLVRRWRRMGCE